MILYWLILATTIATSTVRQTLLRTAAGAPNSMLALVYDPSGMAWRPGGKPGEEV